MSETRPRYHDSRRAGKPAETRGQMSFLTPDDALTLHHLRLLAAEAQRIYRTRTGFDPTEAIRVETPSDVFRLLVDQVEHLTQEQLHVLTLTTKNQVIGAHMVYQGTISGTRVRLAEVFRPALLDAAASVVIAHNHPSGDPSPSPDDVRLTRHMTAAGALLDIDVIDHIVIGGRRFVSLRERGMMDAPGPDLSGGGGGA